MEKIDLKIEEQFANVVLNWDQRSTNGEDFDLDLMMFLLDKENKIISNNHFIFFNNHHSGCKSVVLEKQSDNGFGLDDEKVKINFTNLQEDVFYIDALVSIHQEKGVCKNFGQIKNASIKVENRKQHILYEQNLSEELSKFNFTKLRFKKENNSCWTLDYLSPMESNGLKEIIENYGVKVKK
jgi:tellurium resistance protein TerD